MSGREPGTRLPLRIGDIVFLRVVHCDGCVISEHTSSCYSSVAVLRSWNANVCLPNVHFATFKVEAANKDNSHQKRLRGKPVLYGERIQLMHMFTEKHLYVTTTSTSWTESTNLKVDLKTVDQKGSGGQVFRIVPHNDVRSVGDEVGFGEQFKVESMKVEGYYLHCSDTDLNTVSFSVNQKCLELNLSATESKDSCVLTVEPHYQSTKNDENVFRAGMTVQIVHHQQHSYIAAEGSFAIKLIKDVYSRKRHSGMASIRADSSSADTYWQFETLAHPCSGEQFVWSGSDSAECICRIKHMPTRKYLTVTDHGKVTLQPVHPSDHKKSTPGIKVGDAIVLPDSHIAPNLFAIVSPLNQTGEAPVLVKKSFVLIKHVKSGNWLCLDKALPKVTLQRKGFDDVYLGGTVKITARVTKVQPQSFQWEKQDERNQWQSLSSDGGRIQGQTATLTIDDFQESDVGKYRCVFTHSGGEVKSAPSTLGLDYSQTLQKLILCESPAYGDTFVLNQVSDDLVVLFNTVAGMVPLLADFLKLLQEQSVKGSDPRVISLIDTVLELTDFLKTKSVKHSRTQKKQREKLLRNLGVLRLLMGIIRSCNPSSQKLVCIGCFEVIRNYLVERSSKNKHYLQGNFELFFSKMYLDVGAEDVVVSMLKDNQGLLSKVTRERMEDIISHLTDEEVESPDPRLLDLLGNLCVCAKFPVAATQNLLKEILVDDHGKEIFYQTNCVTPPGDTEQVVTLLDPRTGDTDSASTVAYLKVSRGQSHQFRFLMAQMELFVKLSKGGNKSVARSLDRGGYVSCDTLQLCATSKDIHVGFRSVCIELINVMYVDVSDNKTIKEMLAIDYHEATENPQLSLTKVQRGLRDWMKKYLECTNLKSQTKSEEIFIMSVMLGLLAEMVKNGFYYSSEEVTSLLQVLLSYLEQDVGIEGTQTHNLMADDEASADHSTGTSKDSKIPVLRVKQRVLEVINELLQIQVHLQLQCIVSKFRDKNESSSNANLSDEFGKDRLITQENSDKLKSVLRDLTKRHDFQTDLMWASLQLLIQFHSMDCILFHKAMEIELVFAHKSKDTLEAAKEHLPQLKRSLDLDSDDVSFRSPPLIKLCLPDGIEPSPKIQKILVSCGFLSALLKYISNQARRSRTDSCLPTGTITNIQYCLKFLTALARRNEAVQLRVYEHVDEILEIGRVLCTDWDLNDETPSPLSCMAELLTELFIHNSELCLRVREDQMLGIFQLVVQSKSDESGQNALLLTLQAIGKIEDMGVPVSRNQEYIIKCFCRLRGEFCDHLFGERVDFYRKKLLQKGGDSKNQKLLLNMTDLLATCSEGDNIYIDSMCQSVYPPRELLNVLLNHKGIPISRKIPFARFLVWVFMDVQADSLTSQLFKQKGLLKDWLQHIATLLASLCTALNEMPEEEHQYVRRELTLASWKHLSDFPEKISHRLPKAKCEAQFVTMEDGTLQRGVLSFLMEGVMPALRMFYSECFQRLQDPKLSDKKYRESLLGVSSDIHENLMRLFPIVSSHFTSERQTLLFQDAILVIATVDTKLTQRVMSEAALKRSFKATHPSIGEEDEMYNVEYEQFVALKSSYRALVPYIEDEKEESICLKFKQECSMKLQEATECCDIDIESNQCFPHEAGFQEHLSDFYDSMGGLSKERVKVLLDQLCSSFTKILQEKSRTIQPNREHQDRVQIGVRCLQLLRTMLQREILEAEPQLRKEKPEEFRRKCKKLKQLQGELGGQKALWVVLSVVAYPSDEVSQQALAFLSALLYAGNEKVQQQLQSLFQSDPHRSMEAFMSITQTLLIRAAACYKARHSVLEALLSRTRQHYELVEKYHKVMGGGVPEVEDEATTSLHGGGFQYEQLREKAVIVIDASVEEPDQYAEHLKVQPEEETLTHEKLNLEEISSVPIEPPPPEEERIDGLPGPFELKPPQSLLQEEESFPSLTPTTINAMRFEELIRCRRDLEEKKDNLQAEVADAEEEVESLRSKIECLTDQLQQTVSENSQFIEKNEELLKEAQTREKECARVSGEIEELHEWGNDVLKELLEVTFPELAALVERVQPLNDERTRLFGMAEQLGLGILMQCDAPPLRVRAAALHWDAEARDDDQDRFTSGLKVDADTDDEQDLRRQLAFRSPSPMRLEIERIRFAEEVQNLDEEIKRLERSQQKLEREVHDLESNKAPLEEKLKSATEACAQTKAENKQLQKRVADAKKRLETLGETWREMKETVENLQSSQWSADKLVKNKKLLEEDIEKLNSFVSSQSEGAIGKLDSAAPVMRFTEVQDSASYELMIKRRVKELKQKLVDLTNPEVEEEATSVMGDNDSQMEEEIDFSTPSSLIPPPLERLMSQCVVSLSAEVCTQGVEALMKMSDFSHIKLALGLLGWMCDGQNRTIQDYLREQPGQIKPINIVGDIALFIQKFFSGTPFEFHYSRLTDLWEKASCYQGKLGTKLAQPELPPLDKALKEWRAESLKLIDQILQTLIELCVGNYQNQDVIYDRQITDAINCILATQITDHKYPDELRLLVKVKGSAVELLEAMLEGTNDDSRELATGIFHAVEGKALRKTLAEFHQQRSAAEVKKQKCSDDVDRALFRTYHILLSRGDYLRDLSTDVSKLGEDSDREYKKALKFCKGLSRSVEVVYNDAEGEKVLTRIHFKYDSKDELREEVKTEVKWNVDRDSAEEKVRDFVGWMKACKEDINHQNNLRDNILTYYMTHQRTSKYRHWILLFLTYLLNLLILVSYMVPSSELPPDGKERFDPDDVKFDLTPFVPDVGLWYWPVLHFILGSLHLFFTLWMASEFFAVNFKLPKNRKSSNEKSSDEKSSDEEASKRPNWVYRLINRKPRDERLQLKVYGGKSIYVIVFVLCSILGLCLWGYFYCICLLHIAYRNDTLKRVLRAVFKRGTQLLLLAVLFLIVLYIYSVISFVFVHEAFLVEDDDTDLFCETLGECFITVIRYGLISGLGDIPLVSGSFRESGARLIYDLSFFIIVSTIGLSIVTGIIVDSFGELRDAKWRAMEDMQNFCFICNNPRYEFDRKGPDEFDRHIKDDHNMWDYVYYIVYLERIDVSDHNAIEKYVHRTFSQGRTDFFPLQKAVCLQTEEETLDDKVDSLSARMEGLSRDMTALTTQLKEDKEAAAKS